MTKIVMVDQHPAFRQSLGLMLQEFLAESQITEIDTSTQFLAELKKLSPDLVIMDARLPDRSGIETATIALKRNPALRVIMLIMFPEDKYVQEAKDAGVKGFLPKPPALKELMHACHIVMGGGFYFPSQIKI